MRVRDEIMFGKDSTEHPLLRPHGAGAQVSEAYDTEIRSQFLLNPFTE